MTMIGSFYWKAGITHEKVMESSPSACSSRSRKAPTCCSSTGPAVIRHDRLRTVNGIELVWGEYPDIMMLPAISADVGIKMGADIMQHIGAMA
jgi:hypothetical protein